MTDIELQQTNYFPGNSSSSSVLPQRQSYVPQNAGVPSSYSGPLDGQWEDVPPAVGYVSAQGTMQNQNHTNMASHDMADYQEQPGVLAGPYMYPNVGGIPEHVQAIFPNQGNESFGFVPQGAAPGSAQATRPGPSSAQATRPGPSSGHRTPTLGQPTAENLRRLASRYVNHPDSQVDMVRMEPGYAGRYKVVIILEMADFL